MFFCVFRCGSRDGPQPVSGQSVISSNWAGQGIAIFPDGAGVACARAASRWALLPEIRTVSVITKRKESRAAIRFMGKVSFSEALEECEVRTAYITKRRTL